MAISSSSSSSSSDNKVQNCSKQCLESFKTVQKNFDSEREKHNRAKLEIQGYELALESLESRILGHEKNEMAWGEKYEFQNYDLKCREIKINNLKTELEKVVKERDELKVKIEKWEESSKSLNKLLNSQMNANDKNGLGYGTQMDEMSNKFETDSEISMSIFEVRSSDEEITSANDRFSKADGYHVVPPPITGNFLTPRADISFAGLDEFAIRKKIIESKTTELKTDTSKSKTSETVGNTNEVNIEKPKSVYESVVSTPNINREKVIIEDWNSDDEDDVSEVIPETQTVKTQVDKIGQISKKEGIGFKKIKACFVCKSTDHLIRDCDFHEKRMAKQVELKMWSSVSTARLVCTARPSVSTAKPVCTGKPICIAKPSVSTTRPVYATRPIYPRMDNNIVPSRGRTCLYRKATADESKHYGTEIRFSWVFFLAAKDETSEILCNFIMGLEKPCKSPSISFMRPFGCPLTILNTLDSLGKFDGKSDEGYLLGYSTSSKAFRVYNKRTKRVEENMHINFLEDQPNVTGTGPNYMFIRKMIKDLILRKYMTLPLQTHRTRIPIEDVAPAAHEKTSESSLKDNDIQDLEDVIDKEGQHQMPEDEQVLHDEVEKMMQVTNKLVVSRNRADRLLNVYLMRDNICCDSDKGDAVSSSISATLRIHKDHPKGQILGDPTSAVQTRGKIQKFKLQKVWVLVDLPSGKKVIGIKWVFRNKRDERSIVVKNKAWLVAQGFRRVREEYDYDEVSAHVARLRQLDFKSLPKPLTLNCSNKDDILGYLNHQPKLSQWTGKIQNYGCQFLGRRFISWQCKKQTIVANSTTEEEYVAAANCCGQVL
ncbi:putative ribonuclease H-like domain-containing protein [Tanacetum coccineum]